MILIFLCSDCLQYMFLHLIFRVHFRCERFTQALSRLLFYQQSQQLGRQQLSKPTDLTPEQTQRRSNT